MTQLRSSKECDCKTCTGGESKEGYFGGWTCTCECHYPNPNRKGKITKGESMLNNFPESNIILLEERVKVLEDKINSLEKSVKLSKRRF